MAKATAEDREAYEREIALLKERMQAMEEKQEKLRQALAAHLGVVVE